MTDAALYTYRYPHPAVTVDIVMFTLVEESLRVLLVRRGVEPYRDRWALPGGFVGIDESLEAAATRELREEAGVNHAFLEQLGAFGAPGRDPRERVISVAYWSTVRADLLHLAAGSDASEVTLLPVRALPELAFDHAGIVELAHGRLLERLRTSTIALEFLGEEFTIAELQSVHESILGKKVDKRNFRKWAQEQRYIQSTGKKRRGGQHRPAEVFRADHQNPSDRVVALESVLPVKPDTPASIDKNTYRQGYDEGYRAGAESVQKLFVAAYRATIEHSPRKKKKGG